MKQWQWQQQLHPQLQCLLHNFHRKGLALTKKWARMSRSNWKKIIWAFIQSVKILHFRLYLYKPNINLIGLRSEEYGVLYSTIAATDSIRETMLLLWWIFALFKMIIDRDSRRVWFPNTGNSFSFIHMVNNSNLIVPIVSSSSWLFFYLSMNSHVGRTNPFTLVAAIDI